MKQKSLWLIAVMILLIAATAATAKTRAVASGNQLLQVKQLSDNLRMQYTAAELEKGVYVGSNFCLACHTSKASYRDTNHASFVRRPLENWSLVPGKGVIADYDRNGVDDFRQGLDFNKINSVFDKYKPNAPVLSVENGKYFITVGSLKMPMVLTVAGQRQGSAATAQRYVVKVPVTDTADKLSVGNYFAPISYSTIDGWAANSPNAWWDATTFAPKFAAGIGAASLVASGGPSSHSMGCAICHSTGLTGLQKQASGEYLAQIAPAILYNSDDPTVIDYENDGEMELMNISCENCHGPGSLHILAGGDGSKIVNPKTLTAKQQADICGQCHVTGKSVPAGTFSFPYNDATNTRWTPFDAQRGLNLDQFYTMAGNKWPDGVHYNGGRPFNQWATSLHATFTAHTVGCPECHDPHEEGEGALLRETMQADTYVVKTSAEDNTLCLSCHAKYGPFATLTRADIFDMTQGKAEAFDKVAKTVEAHTHHPYAPERIMGLSRCTGCHMSTGHNFDAISPEATLKYQDKGGMINSCAAGCHNNLVNVFNLGVKGTATTWNNPFDVKNANALKPYFGEGGVWWDTKK